MEDEDRNAVVAITLRLPYNAHKELRRIALEHEGSMNGLINGLIDNYLEEHSDCPVCH